MLYCLDSSGHLYGTLLNILVTPMKQEGACTVLRMVSKFIAFKMHHFKLLYPQAMSFTGNVEM